VSLPPGQHAVEGFPRFGTHLYKPPPAIPADPVIEIGGAVTRPSSVPVAELAVLPRRELTADFHCVAGWSATDLQWEGVPFEALFRSVLESLVRPGSSITHVAFQGFDGFRWTALIVDALGEDVLIADRLDGHPLDLDHGAPARLVSPNQYGYVSVKHLCRIDLLTAKPPENYGAPSWFVEASLRSPLINPHRRARVWHEERHHYLPGRWVRPFYRLLIPPIRSLSARGARRVP
jgi:DMSO/TMAO reductase YedYZ molybdopterin-dependent catalytic subunit